jgi:ABC-type Zn uptake system ZnuABC Zn-binding protein ZnuA
MGAVGPASASCSFWLVQVPPPKRSYSSQPSTKDLKKIVMLLKDSELNSSSRHTFSQNWQYSKYERRKS